MNLALIHCMKIKYPRLSLAISAGLVGFYVTNAMWFYALSTRSAALEAVLMAVLFFCIAIYYSTTLRNEPGKSESVPIPLPVETKKVCPPHTWEYNKIYGGHICKHCNKPPKG
jgi:hypothetical protein